MTTASKLVIIILACMIAVCAAVLFSFIYGYFLLETGEQSTGQYVVDITEEPGPAAMIRETEPALETVPSPMHEPVKETEPGSELDLELSPEPDPEPDLTLFDTPDSLTAPVNGSADSNDAASDDAASKDVALGTADPGIDYVPENINSYATEILKLTNEQRAAHGLEPLTSGGSVLTEAAITRATEIIEHWSHNRPDGRSCFTAYTDLGGTYKHLAENLAMGQKSPEAAVEAWMSSTAGHREAILNPNFTQLGVGVVKDVNGKYYWAQMFLG